MSNSKIITKPPISVKKLPSGLNVVVISIEKAPIVCVNMAYRVGSKNEIRGKTGFAHLFEHLMFEGTKNIPKGGFDEYCSIAGGTNNAYTTYDLTSYIMTLPKHQIELGLWLEADRMYNFEITSEALENQQKVVTEEINQTVMNQPYGRWREYLASAAFDAASGYSWEVHGSIEDVRNCSLDDARNFYDKFYRPKNAVLTLCGDISPETGFSLAEKYFSREIKSTAPNYRNNFTNSFRKKGISDSFKDESAPLDAAFLSFHCPGFKDELSYVSDIASFVLGGGRSSRLYDNLVHKKELASYTGSFADKREDSSLLTIFAIASEPNISADQLFEEMENIVSDLTKNGSIEKEIEKSRNQVSTSIAAEMQYSSGIADMASINSLFWNDPARAFTVLDRYLGVDSKQVNLFADEYLNVQDAVKISVIPGNK